MPLKNNFRKGFFSFCLNLITSLFLVVQLIGFLNLCGALVLVLGVLDPLAVQGEVGLGAVLDVLSLAVLLSHLCSAFIRFFSAVQQGCQRSRYTEN